MTREEAIEAVDRAIHDSYFESEPLPGETRAPVEEIWRSMATAAYDALLPHIQAERERVREALKCMLGAFDTPIARRRDTGEFATEARMTARAAMKETPSTCIDCDMMDYPCPKHHPASRHD